MSISIKYNIIMIHGHGTPQLNGTRAHTWFSYYFYMLKHPVFINEYYGGLGLAALDAAAVNIKRDIDVWYANNITGQSYHSILLAGYSCGGATACRTLEYLNSIGYYDIPYIGLGDAAFIRGETSHYLVNPPSGSNRVRYKKNYFQTWENSGYNAEIHDEVPGYSNYNLDGEINRSEAHASCCSIAYKKIIEDMRWCISNDV